jgi:hypothetical protein
MFFVVYIYWGEVRYLDNTLNDNRVYSGMGYFINHAVNHHPGVPASKYANIQDVLDNPDDVKETTKEGKRSVIFIKEIDRYNAVVVHVEANDDGKIVFHTSFFEQRKKPYASLPSIRSKSLEVGALSISRVEDSAPGRSLSARKDNAKVQNFLIPTKNGTSIALDTNGEPLPHQIQPFNSRDNARFQIGCKVTQNSNTNQILAENNFASPQNRDEKLEQQNGLLAPVKATPTRALVEMLRKTSMHEEAQQSTSKQHKIV